jgi:formate hydrogenlyase subunit 3/multisubunit Na+/H+ antiporter MnhD subunit
MIILIIAVWLVSIFYSWGTMLSEADWNDSYRDMAGFTITIIALGPIGACSWALASNFNQHGFKLHL